ncbi:MAG: hypothetical protein GPI90_14105 [Microcystis aeruginosa K13-05]|uniref:hypothetical protein n=1 Tax=unclassified Microcystis TaxID=2643300 RepID=UPI0022CB3C94|nr:MULTISPECIES: hypothetical protein [unclassified Microcystis]MCZ8117900.1 hypothetical protein [Microcystis sp. LE18-22.4A]MCZ8362870.1 hypothetical protein [Microcystis sp. LE19-251.1A]NCR81090.1 hypothetical protein [Microcystis aeruginosa K13-10]NCR85717.1 hypothetical protein [Microcystis aeruginosa K13-05]MCZ8026578.1 hypothetical protein [Microcystis sp. LE19-10.1B]
MTPSKSVKPHTPHPTPYTLPLGKTFSADPTYLTICVEFSFFCQYSRQESPEIYLYRPNFAAKAIATGKMRCSCT